MANLPEPETPTFDPVTQIETNEPVIGGPGGVSNRGLQELVNRTAWLKAELQDAQDQIVGGEGSGVDADLVRGLPADFSSLVGEVGYQKLPSGLIVQWGEIGSAGFGGTTGLIEVTLPIAFPNALYSAYACDIALATDAATSHVISWRTDLTTLSKVAFIATKVLDQTLNDSAFTWMAIGS